MKLFKSVALTAMMTGIVAVTAACGSDEAENNGLQGDIVIDGSSTVYPILEAVSEEYMYEQPKVRVSVGYSGTGGGFKKFIAEETDMTNASRSIKDEEKSHLDEKGIEYTELKLAFDGISIAVNNDNDFVDQLTVDELKTLWIDNGTEKKWSDIRPNWPKKEIKFYSPGTESGTFDYFNEIILEEKPIVSNATLSEDDNVLVQGVSGDKNAIGFFGYAYYAENKDKLKIVPIVGDTGKPVEPTVDTIKNGEYTPLSRPLYAYVSNKSIAEKEQFADFSEFMINNAGILAEEVGYVALPEEEYKNDLERLGELKK